MASQPTVELMQTIKFVIKMCPGQLVVFNRETLLFFIGFLHSFQIQKHCQRSNARTFLKLWMKTKSL